MQIRITYTIVLLLIALFVTPISGATPSPAIWNPDVRNAWVEAQKTRRPMLVLVTMDGCHYCHKLLHGTFRDRRVLADLSASYVATIMPRERYQGLVKQLRINSFPTTLIVRPDGRIDKVIQGYVGPGKMRQHLRASATPPRLTKR